MINRYKLAPYLKVYDGVENIWSPYIMFKQKNNIKNKVLNTDKFGFRFTDSDTKYTILNKHNIKDNFNEYVVVGGSTAFGVGASSDRNTISSKLSQMTNNTIYNFGLRAGNSFQELILFLNSYIEKKILLSPPFFYQNEFNKSLKNINQSLKKKILNIFNKSEEDGNSYGEFSWANNLEHILRTWKAISEKNNFEIIYALQPFFSWSKKNFSEEEEKLFDEIKRMNSLRTWKILLKLSEKQHHNTKEIYKKICESANIKFLDLNELFQSCKSSDWLFVDTLHCTDLGYEKIAKKLTEEI